MRKYRKGECSHWILSGENRRYVFADEIWKRGLLISVAEVQKNFPMTVYAFCVLDEEAHFLIWMQKNQMKRATGQVAKQFEDYIQRVQGSRNACLKSSITSPREMDEEQLLDVCVQIHLLPQKRRCVRRYADYYWSSYREYFHGSDFGVTHTKMLLGFLDGNLVKARKKFAALHRDRLR